MAAPKKRQSLTRRRTRRNALEKQIVLPATVKCKNCMNHKLSHHMCLICGYYKGKLILMPKVKKAKSEVSNNIQ